MTKRLLAAVLLCAVAVPCVWAAEGISENAARDKALKALLERVQALKLNEKHAVVDYLENTSLKPEQYKAALLKGAEELPPTEYLEDGRARIAVRIAPAAVIENLKQVAKEQGEGGAALDVSELEKLGEATELKATGEGTPAPIKNIPGWADATLRARLDAAAAAHADAVSRLTALSADLTAGKETLKALTESKPTVKEAVAKFFNGVRPAAMTYFADGIVAVRLEVTGAEMWNGLAAALKPAKPEEAAVIDPKELTDAAARDAGNKLIATGYARLDGNAVDAAQLTAQPKKIEVREEAPASILEGN